MRIQDVRQDGIKKVGMKIWFGRSIGGVLVSEVQKVVEFNYLFMFIIYFFGWIGFLYVLFVGILFSVWIKGWYGVGFS